MQIFVEKSKALIFQYILCYLFITYYQSQLRHFNILLKYLKQNKPQIKMGQGQNWGVIHNQMNCPIIYIFHYSQLECLEQTVKKGFDSTISMNAKTQGVMAGAKAKAYLEDQLKKAKVDVDGVYILQAKQITTVGLLNHNFDKAKYWTIVALQQKPIILFQKSKINSNEDIRLKIRQDGSTQNIKSDQAKQLKKLALSGTLKKSICAFNDCKFGSSQKEEKEKCRLCNNTRQVIWQCKDNPLAHLCCQGCHDAANAQKQAGNQINNILKQ